MLGKGIRLCEGCGPQGPGGGGGGAEGSVKMFEIVVYTTISFFFLFIIEGRWRTY